MDDANERGAIGVVARAASILRTLGEVPGGMSLGQISRHTGLARSTVQRIVGALDAERLVVASGAAGQITLGPELLRLGAATGQSVPPALRAAIRSLSAELGETVDLSVIRGREAIFLDQVTGPQRLVAVSHVGAAFPLYCCASGKAYLAPMENAEIARLIGTSYQRRTSRTRTTLAALLDDLAEVRRAGYAIDDEEHTAGISAVGIALQGAGGVWFGISVPIPSQRFPDKRDSVIRCLLEVRATPDLLAG
jgi:DNA-binding IclR family transcriptional regulator